MKMRIFSIVLGLLLILNTSLVFAFDAVEYVDVDTSIPVVAKAVPRKLYGINTRAGGGVYKYTIGWSYAEADSYLDDEESGKHPIDRICAIYLNITSEGELKQHIENNKYNSSHAYIKADKVYLFTTIKGRFIFEQSGYQTVDETLTYNK